MMMRKLGLSLAAVLALGAQGVGAQGLPAETAARQAADTQLQNNINAEAAARAAAEAALQNAIAAEAASRSAADTALGATDTQLQSQIDQLRNSIGSSGGTTSVDCGSGGSVNDALAAGAKKIIVRGRCNESITVNQDDVTLQADPAGGEIHGPDAAANTVTVHGHRVTIDGLTISGGRNGVSGVGSTNLNMRNCTVQSTGRTGIAYINNAGGSVDTCQVHSNPRDGIAAQGGQVTVVNSMITNNSRFGVIILNGASANIGINDRQEPAGNTISQNGSYGIIVTTGGTAWIAMNQVTANGADATMPGRSGIGIFQATANLVGGNTISDNPGTGITMTGATVTMGNGDVGITPVNTITGNGNSTSPGGVFAFLGSSVLMRNASIQANHGPGLTLSTRSQAQVSGTTIQSNLDVPTPNGFVNAGDGIRLLLGSALLPTGPNSIVSDNQGFGIQCFDAESSVNGLPPIQAPNIPGMPPESVPVPPFTTMSGNGLGNVSGGCTGF
ncbi:MAG TPA: right-handed parallel beta-helix repeat-containing protein [Burkholderiales bacterium]|jgi:hypothetical protein|nr:right-handed parallel beta-helix repeat-containing protein [Burkholderiales bacterium]